ncbi:hypothetical protein D3C87_1466560 [compost metagenome]
MRDIIERHRKWVGPYAGKIDLADDGDAPTLKVEQDRDGNSCHDDDEAAGDGGAPAQEKQHGECHNADGDAFKAPVLRAGEDLQENGKWLARLRLYPEEARQLLYGDQNGEAEGKTAQHRARDDTRQGAEPRGSRKQKQ